MRNLLRRIALIPVPAIMFVLALGLVAYGVFALTPWAEGLPMCQALGNSHPAEVAVGAFFILIGGCRLLGARSHNHRLLLAVPYGMCMAYTFIALVQGEVVGWSRLTFLPFAACAFIAGICRLALLYGPRE